MSAVHCMRSNNPLLLKDDVGSAKPSAYNLPNNNFTYGKADIKDAEGAKEITMSWKSHVPNVPPSKMAIKTKNFLSLNKSSLSDARCISAKQQTVYRNSNPTYFRPRRKKNFDLPCRSDHIYGKRVRPSTPIVHVISNKFGCASERQILKKYEHINSIEEKINCRSQYKIKPTKASQGHSKIAHLAQKEVKIRPELFKMKKFLKVHSKIAPFKIASLGKKKTQLEQQSILPEALKSNEALEKPSEIQETTEETELKKTKVCENLIDNIENVSNQTKADNENNMCGC